ncbi:HTTM domain-containing protein [Streptomyces sp. BG9H]|uniref:HTTM domain-containing protein n=1 Tax=Streptomyces anatolicus TaxID=2675858 RepID=A0ABS6YNM3_9ACTN|nr:HTTM domain-containing protein [Streptomyces anatolicus]MBW5423010.1 HTTM domain-containing protein [Streptomyces anatolicus]
MTRHGLPLAQGLSKVTGFALGPYQTAVVRIGFAGTWLFFLLRELPHRHEMYGPDGPWDWGMARQLISGNGAFTALMWSDGHLWFEAVYALAVLSSALLMLGWHTRAMSVLFMIGVLSLQNRSIFIGDGGDNVIHLMATYLVLTRCAQVWSLDARRAARARGEGVVDPADGPGMADGAERPDAVHAAGGVDRVGPVLWWVLGIALSVVTFMGELSPGWLLIFWGLWLVHGLWWAVGRRAPHSELRKLLDVVANLAHNAGLLVIMIEACLIYATAGWYKIQGSRWQDGTAVYYPLNLDYFSPWHTLSELLSSNGLILLLVTYGTVAVQVAFPFTLFNRRVKNVLLAAMIFEHAVIAVVLGLPFFSLAMITADAVFLPTSFLRRLGGGVARARGALASRVRRKRAVPADRRQDEEPAEHARVGFTP